MTVTERAAAEERSRVSEVVERLRGRYPGVAPERIVQAVAQAHHELDTARLRDYVPVLVEKRARDLLRHSDR